jgi:RNA polymerase sigma-70 factor (ECF subfamily)
MHQGPDAGLVLVNNLIAGGQLQNYHLAHAAQADLHRRLGHVAEAQAAYGRALALTQQEPERRFLNRRLAGLAEQ